MDKEISMSVSPAVTPDGEKVVYVLFQDGKNSAELMAPQGKVLRNSGFGEEELKNLSEYVKNEWDTIVGLAKEVNPMRAFLDTPVRPKE